MRDDGREIIRIPAEQTLHRVSVVCAIISRLCLVCKARHCKYVISASISKCQSCNTKFPASKALCSTDVTSIETCYPSHLAGTQHRGQNFQLNITGPLPSVPAPVSLYPGTGESGSMFIHFTSTSSFGQPCHVASDGPNIPRGPFASMISSSAARSCTRSGQACRKRRVDTQWRCPPPHPSANSSYAS